MVLWYGKRRCGVFHLGFGIHDLEEAFSRPEGTSEVLEGGSEWLHGLEATEDDQRQEGQVHAPHLSPRDKWDREYEHREHREVHKKVAEGVPEPGDEGHPSLYTAQPEIQPGNGAFVIA